MKRNILKIVLITIILFISMQVLTFATVLKLNIKVDKEEIKVGDEVKVTVQWNEEMQAADFSLVYDDNKLEYVECELEDYFINNENGEVKTAWFSDNGTDITKIEYTFKAKKGGTVNLSTKINGGFATGNLEIPQEYENSEIKLKIKTNINITIISSIIVVIMVVIIFGCLKIRKKK